MAKEPLTASGGAPGNVDDLITLLVAKLSTLTQNAAPAGPVVPETLTAYLEEELAAKREARDRAKRESIELAKRNAENARVAMEVTKMEQESCSHMKPNGQSRLAGQTVSSGDEVLICTNCQIQVRNGCYPDGTRIPPHMIPPDVARGYAPAY